MALDPSVILSGVSQPPPNPLAMAGNVVSTQNALQQAALGRINLQNAQAQLLARQSIGRAFQAATDPTTGVTDYGRLQGLIANDQNAAWMAPQITQQIQEQQKRQFDLQQQALSQATNRRNALSAGVAPLLRLGSNVQPSDVYGVISGLHAAGFPTADIIQNVAATMPTQTPGQPADPTYGAKLHNWVLNTFGASLPAADAAKVFTPAPARVDTGGSIQSYDANPITNPGAANFQAPMTLTPAQAVNPVPGPPNARGAPTSMPAATYAAQQGLGYLNGGGAPVAAGQQPGASRSSSFGTSTGRIPSALMGPGGAPTGQGASNPAVPAASASTPAPMVTGLPPGVDAGMKAAAASSAQQWANQQAAVGGSAGRIYQLQTALGALQSLGQTGTGPSSGTINNVKSYLQSLPLIGQSLNIDPTNVANYDVANKYLTQYAAARAGAHGPTTDSQLATTLSGNASTHISNLAAADVVRANLGLEKMDQAQMQAFQSARDPMTGLPLTPDQFSNFSANWNQQMDPRAFVADQLPAQQFTSLVNSMPPADQAKFKNTFNTAIQNGWIDQPSWMQTAPASSQSAASASPPPPSTAPVQAPAAITGGAGNGN